MIISFFECNLHTNRRHFVHFIDEAEFFFPRSKHVPRLAEVFSYASDVLAAAHFNFKKDEMSSGKLEI